MSEPKQAHTAKTTVLDPLGDEDLDLAPQYRITSYGADYPVETIVRRLETRQLFTPDFQRSFVWDFKTASRFVESLLLGLPVPGIFLSVEPNDQTHLIIDGQQRLKTLQSFYAGVFSNDRTKDRVFKLVGSESQFKGQGYGDLSPEDQRRLDNSIIHATIIRQDVPAEDQSSIYHIFERLNSGSSQLTPQEIRSALFHGPLVRLIGELNSVPAWRSIYGPAAINKRDQELIVRFLAFYFHGDEYSSPMKSFLNRYLGHNRSLQYQTESEITGVFTDTVNLAWGSLGSRAFRLGRALNAAVLDSVLVGLAQRLSKGHIKNENAVESAYLALLENEHFVSGITKATANEQRVLERFTEARKAFSDLA